MGSRVYQHTFDNGLTLLAEHMSHVRSAAFNFLIPAGCVYDPPQFLGIGSILSEMIMRGAGERDSRELALVLDNLGLDRHESAGQVHMRFWGSTLSRNLLAALEIYADVLRRPRLPADEVDAVRALAMQDLQALEDDPRQLAFVELRRRHWPFPLGQDRRGNAETLTAIDAAKVRGHFEKTFGPREAILSVAGNIEWSRLRDLVGKRFGDWQGGGDPKFALRPPPGGQAHIKKDTTQTQIALAYPSVPFGHPEYFDALGAVQVLSGGMGARLFTEVREKRALCYAVSANHQSFKNRACVMCYAGTRNDRAQATLDVTIAELQRLADGVLDEEVDRVKAGLKSSLIMQEESTSARAGALASDWYYLRRIRSFEEIEKAINDLSADSIVDHLRRHPARDFTIVTLGPKKLRIGKLVAS